MRITAFLRNRTFVYALVSGLSAAIAALLLITLIPGLRSPSELDLTPNSGSRKIMTAKKSITDIEISKGNAIAALPIESFSLLKGSIKTGTRLNVIGVINSGQPVGLPAQTILTNIMVVALPAAASSSIREADDGVLVSLSQEECERLYGFLSSGTIRVVVAGI